MGSFQSESPKPETYNIGSDRTSNYSNDPYVREFFEQDVMPRYMREHPNATKQELDALRQAYHYEQSVGKLPLGVLGRTSYNEGDPTITYSDMLGNPSRHTIVHENTHAYRYGIDQAHPSYNSGFDPKEQKLLNNAYSMDDYGSINPTSEMGATNAELRYVYWKKLREELGRTPTLEEMDDYINKLSLQTLENTESKINSYGRHSVNNQRENRPQKMEGIKDIFKKTQAKRDALIHVADNSEQTDMANLAKQGCKLRFKNKLHK